MTIPAKNGFDEKLVHRARLFKALAHPARLEILLYLSEMKTCMTGNIADELPLSRTTVNQHLKELKDAGLIKGTVDGVRTNYCLHGETIQTMKEHIHDFLEQIVAKKNFC